MHVALFFVGKVVVVRRVDWGDPQSFCNTNCLSNLDSTTSLNQPDFCRRQSPPLVFFPLSWFSLDEVRHDFW
jgi:hypothetical protein